MKKVFFSEAAQNIIPVDEVGNYELVGYAGKEAPIKGILALDSSKVMGVTLVNGPADWDIDMPAVHYALECSPRTVREMMKEKQNQFDFYIFSNMEDLIKWILE